MSKTKHKHLNTKVKILNALMDKAHVKWSTITIGHEDFCHAFGFRDTEEMTEYCQPELIKQ